MRGYGHVYDLPFNNPLNSPSFAASSSFLKSLVFCARSFRWTVESRWYVMISEAVLSSVGTKVVRSISTAAVSSRHSYMVPIISLLLHAEMACWNLFSSPSGAWPGAPFAGSGACCGCCPSPGPVPSASAIVLRASHESKRLSNVYR